MCFTNSKASLYWIQGVHHEWKQFVENRVTAITSLIPPEFWKHCPGKENPADIPCRGMNASALSESSIWLPGPNWLWHQTEEVDVSEIGVPEECLGEMKHKDLTCSLVATGSTKPSEKLSQVICPEHYSSSSRLFRVTALVFRFIARLRKPFHSSDPLNPEVSTEEINQARLRWIRNMQARMTEDRNFPTWKRQFGLYQDKQGLWRCGGRMSHSSLPPSAQNPILLSKEHHLTTLLILDAHKRVLHNGGRHFQSCDPPTGSYGRDRLLRRYFVAVLSVEGLREHPARVCQPHLYLSFVSRNQDLSKLPELILLDLCMSEHLTRQGQSRRGWFCTHVIQHGQSTLS